MPLYKYLPRKYGELLLSSGQVKIGSLSEYRNIERYGDAIGDAGEGRKQPYLHADNERWENESLPDFLRPAIQIANGATVGVKGITFVREIESEEFNIFCVSRRAAKDLLEKFNSDVCVEIFAPELFFRKLRRAMRPYGRYIGLFDCHYGNRSHDYREHNIHPALIKPDDYREQCEVRALWAPHAPPATSIILTVPTLPNYCREIDPAAL